MLILYIVNTENIIRIIGLDLLTLHSIQQQKKKHIQVVFLLDIYYY